VGRWRVGMWLRSTDFVVWPRARCRPVRTWAASGNTSWTAATYGWWWSLTPVVGALPALPRRRRKKVWDGKTLGAYAAAGS
jgi:hypothetical protein